MQERFAQLADTIQSQHVNGRLICCQLPSLKTQFDLGNLGHKLERFEGRLGQKAGQRSHVGHVLHIVYQRGANRAYLAFEWIAWGALEIFIRRIQRYLLRIRTDLDHLFEI